MIDIIDKTTKQEVKPKYDLSNLFKIDSFICMVGQVSPNNYQIFAFDSYKNSYSLNRMDDRIFSNKSEVFYYLDSKGAIEITGYVTVFNI